MYSLLIKQIAQRSWHMTFVFQNLKPTLCAQTHSGTMHFSGLGWGGGVRVGFWGRVGLSPLAEGCKAPLFPPLLKGTKWEDSAHIDGTTCVCEKIWLRTERWSLTWGFFLLLLSLLFFLGFAESKPSLRKGAGLTSGVQRMSERERKVNKGGWCK